MIRPILRMANESRSRVLDVSKTLFSNRSSTRAPQHRCSPASPFAYRPVLHRATLPYMRRVLMSLLVLAPALSAQVRSRATAVFSNPAASLVVPRLGVDVGFDGPDVGWNESQFTAFFGRPRVSERSDRLGVRIALDSLRAPQQRGHAAIGAMLGLAIGAGAGYLVAIPRVRATERRSDGPLQQIEFLIDPVIGGVIGAVIGAAVGSHVH